MVSNRQHNLLFSVLILPITLSGYCHAINNVCKTFSDYLIDMDGNPNCWYNPELYMNGSQILQHRGYKYEQHEVETEDGYFLTMLRLPQPEGVQRKGVIMIMPPMTSSSDCFIGIGNDSFAFMVWHSGYEVWLGNVRGTFYGRKHRKYDPDKDMVFWEFSFHEMGIYDFPASLELISSVTGNFDITIVGYSLTSTAGLIYGALRPDHSLKYTKAIVLWAPAANMVHGRTATRQLSVLGNLLEILGPQGVRDLAPHNKAVWDLLGACRRGPLIIVCLSLDLYVLGGKGTTGVRPDWFPIKYSHNPSGVSYRLVSHYLQLTKQGEFKQFDYGLEGNVRRYNSSKPPFYPVENIRTPTVLVYGTLDLEATEIDVLAMFDKLSDEANIYKPVKIIGMYHGGFVYNDMAPKLAYRPTIEFFDRIYNKE